MKKEFKYLTIALCALALGASLNNYAMSDIPKNYKIAIVDVQKIIVSSEQINILKSEQKIKIKELVTFVDKAKKDIEKETDAAKKKELETKYNKELNDKKAVIDKEYTKKLSEIDKSISTIIENTAKKNNYDIVLTKNVVLYGGEDITEEIAKSIK